MIWAISTLALMGLGLLLLIEGAAYLMDRSGSTL
jgi:hypothetical protein